MKNFPGKNGKLSPAKVDAPLVISVKSHRDLLANVMEKESLACTFSTESQIRPERKSVYAARINIFAKAEESVESTAPPIYAEHARALPEYALWARFYLQILPPSAVINRFYYF